MPQRPGFMLCVCAGAALVAGALFSCAQRRIPAPSEGPRDPHSHANPHEVRVRHVDLDLRLDFAAQVVTGRVKLDLERLDTAAPLVLDAHGLTIAAVRGTDGTPRLHRMESRGLPEGLGEALSITLAAGDTSVVIDYFTRPSAEALQWLAPAQTAGGTRPFLFTQGQSVLTRTWIPLQDSPAVRVTTSARISAPEGLVALMAAEQLGRDAEGRFLFRMAQPIPPYLIAIACGDLTFRPISERCGVWAEPSVVDGARAEFEDMERMVTAAEELFGAYRWGRFDVLVLPPSFPFGGMENPCLTFATPTILAGDKSLVSLVAHELAHSWSGNLVTNATWRDFWLNEGFTVYFERRIMERVYGAERAAMERQLARADLVRDMAAMEPWQQVLYTDLDGRHPDDGFSSVPYDKGALFLERLEELFGRERFDTFLRRWFDGHAFQSVDTRTFRRFLERELLEREPALADTLDVERWITAAGLPEDAPDPRSTLLERVDEQVARWRTEARAEVLSTRAWSTQEWLHFLEVLGPELDARGMAELDRAFALTQSGNAEVLCVWLRLALQHSYEPADAAVRRFLSSVGRRKFLTPLYKQWAATPAGLVEARAFYAATRPRYHAVSRGTLDALLGASSSTLR